MVAIKTEKVGDLTIKIFIDESPESPRDWDNIGTMVCFHKLYNMGDKDHGFSGPEDFQKKLDKRGVISLPIYMMDHSGQSLSTNPDNFRACDPMGWDWGELGYIFVEPEKVRKEYNTKRITKGIRERVLKALNSEVETYNQYIQGDVYGYVLEDSEGNQLESCWGYHGLDYCLSEAKFMAEYSLKNLIGHGLGI